MLDERLSVETDIATWFLFHPADLAYRCHDPLTWHTEDFAIANDFAAGRLIAVGTGQDGSTSIRFTNQGLTDREQTYARKSAQFRLQVQHGCLYLDGGWNLPSASQLDPEACYRDRHGWITLPNGLYRVTVHSIAWHEEPGALDENNYSLPHALSAYVADIQPVSSLAAIDFPTCIPDLYSSVYDSEYDYPICWDTADNQQPLALEYPVLYWNQVIFPGVEQELWFEPETPFEIADRQLVISYSIETGAIGTLFEIREMSAHFYIDYFLRDYQAEGQLSDRDYCMGTGKQLVQLKRVFEKSATLWAEVEPYEPLPSLVDPAAIDRLKQLFADYAENNSAYGHRIQFHRFYAEKVAALTQTSAICWMIAHALEWTSEQNQALFGLSESDLVAELSQALAAL